ncbi:MAG: Bacterial conjugation TrbI-like protein [Pseudomonadota bacterium]|jgi:hypothetical protein
MSEKATVTIAKDNGHKNRWGLSDLMYRQEGPKRSLNGKVAAGIFGALMILGVGYSIVSEFSNPSSGTIQGEPIGFNGQLNSSPQIEIPRGDTEWRKPSPEFKRASSARTYTGLQVIQRPLLGKIPPGTMVKARFITGASNGPLKATLVEPLVVSGDAIVPEGTVLVGSGSSGEDRLTVQFSKLVFNDGKSQNIEAQGCDVEDQTVGIRGKKISKYAYLLAAGAGLNFVGGLTEGLQEAQVQNGVAVKKNDLKNAALNGASKAALDQSQHILNDVKNKKSVIQVESGKEFYVLFQGD